MPQMPAEDANQKGARPVLIIKRDKSGVGSQRKAVVRGTEPRQYCVERL